MKLNPSLRTRSRNLMASFTWPSVSLFLALCVQAQPLPSKVNSRLSEAPPPAPPALVAAPDDLLTRQSLSAAAPALWSIGDPTDEEQLYLELMNRSRANPTAEGVRL